MISDYSHAISSWLPIDLFSSRGICLQQPPMLSTRGSNTLCERRRRRHNRDSDPALPHAHPLFITHVRYYYLYVFASLTPIMVRNDEPSSFIEGYNADRSPLCTIALYIHPVSVNQLPLLSTATGGHYPASLKVTDLDRSLIHRNPYVKWEKIPRRMNDGVKLAQIYA